MDWLEATIADLVKRKNAAREGSALRTFYVRQLDGLRAYKRGGDLIEYYDPDCWGYY